MLTRTLVALRLSSYLTANVSLISLLGGLTPKLSHLHCVLGGEGGDAELLKLLGGAQVILVDAFRIFFALDSLDNFGDIAAKNI